MFRIHYEWQKGGEPFSRTYPDQDADADNSIFIIRGDNDQGKSTLLQMIALGLFGLRSDDIDEILKEKMRRLIADEAEKCELSFVIETRDRKTKLECRLKNRVPTIVVNGHMKGMDYFNDHYKILFDVPDEPQKKLRPVLTSMRLNLRRYLEFIGTYMKGIRESVESIDRYSEKEKQQKQIRNSLNSMRREETQTERRLNSVEKNLVDIERAYVVNTFERLFKDSSKLQDEQRRLKSRKTKLKKLGAGGGTSGYHEKVENCTMALQELHKAATGVKSETLAKLLGNREARRVQVVLGELKKTFVASDLSDRTADKWTSVLLESLRRLRDKERSAGKFPENDMIQMLTRLIEVLKEYVRIRVPVAGTNGKNVNQFLNELERQKADQERKAGPRVRRLKLIDHFASILDALKGFEAAYSNLPRQKPKQSEFEEIEDRLKSIEPELSSIQKEMNRIQDEYESISNPERRRLRAIGEPDKGKLQDKSKERDQLKRVIEDLKIQIASNEDRLKEYEKAEMPPEHLSREQLIRMQKTADRLFRRLEIWSRDIAELEHSFESGSLSKAPPDEVRADNASEDSSRLYDALGEYFAAILKMVFFEDRAWTVKRVDLIARRYEVDGRKPISFIDIGTGHTALNSLLARIKQDSSGRKKILLIDEITPMDETSRSHLLEEIKRQVERGEVILAVLSQMVDGMKPARLVPVIV